MPRYKVEVTLYSTLDAYDPDSALDRFSNRIGLRHLLRGRGVFQAPNTKVTLLDEPEPDCDDEIEANEVEEAYQLEADVMVDPEAEEQN